MNIVRLLGGRVGWGWGLLDSKLLFHSFLITSPKSFVVYQSLYTSLHNCLVHSFNMAKPSQFSPLYPVSYAYQPLVISTCQLFSVTLHIHNTMSFPYSFVKFSSLPRSHYHREQHLPSLCIENTLEVTFKFEDSKYLFGER